MHTYTVLINYKHHNGHFSHVVTLYAKNAESAARKVAATARNMHRMHGHFILTIWEDERFLFSRLEPACADPENQATQAGTEDAEHALQSRQNRLEQRCFDQRRERAGR